MMRDKYLFYILCIASAMCFIGHGSFGIITKPVWCNYFAVLGIGHNTAYQLMPWMGSVDVLLGISLLFYPTRAVFLWLVVWGTITAALRPLSGEPFAEFIERAGNFGAPLTVLILYGGGENIRSWFSKINPVTSISTDTIAKAINYLKVIVFLLLVGHGWLNLLEKKGLMGQYTALGFSNPGEVARIAGIFEIVAACLTLFRPLRLVLVLLLIWKTGTELFYPHWELFEWIERGGSYGTILALLVALPRTSFESKDILITT